MFRTIKIAALSAFLGLGTLAAVPATAQADGIYFSFGGDDRGGIYIRDRDRDRGGWDRHGRDRGDWGRGDRDRWDRRGPACSPREAVAKAYRMGLRHVEVTRANRNTIRVTGRTRHDRSSIVFARAPHCPVIRTR